MGCIDWCELVRDIIERDYGDHCVLCWVELWDIVDNGPSLGSRKSMLSCEELWDGGDWWSICVETLELWGTVQWSCDEELWSICGIARAVSCPRFLSIVRHAPLFFFSQTLPNRFLTNSTSRGNENEHMGVLAKWRGMHAPILTIVTNHILQLHVQIRLVSVDKHIFRPYSDGTSLLQLPNLQGRGTSSRWGVNFPFGNLEFGGNSFGERFSLLQSSSIQHGNTAWHTKLVCKVLVWVSTRLDD